MLAAAKSLKKTVQTFAPAKAPAKAVAAKIATAKTAHGNGRAIKITRNPEQTKARILAAAKVEFARAGLGGARVDSIAQQADANKRMLYYYFGNKDDLFTAVLEDAYRHIRESEKLLRLDESAPDEAIRRLLAFTWNYYLDHPEFLNLLNSANLHQARHLKKSTKLRTMHSPFVAMLDNILERGRKNDMFRAGVDPVQLYISIAALCYFYLGNNYTLSAIFGRDLLSPRAKSERLAHMTALVLGYLFKS